ncbi:MAG: response regulator transcription factor [Acidobacteriia bacterium]|nr:response regulator transcription factor [Terriglobia bacterium]
MKCILVDDHTLFREGLRRLLESEADLEVVGEAGNAVEALSKIRELRPDVALMDIGMPGMSSFEAARLIEKNLPGTRIIFLTMFEDEEYLQQALNVGAAGYMLKDAPAANLISAVREVHQGRQCLSPRVAEKLGDESRARFQASPGPERGSALTPREREVVKMIAEGNSVREIAGLLGLSAKTVEVHKFNLMRKLRIHNKAHLVTYAIQKKIVKIPAGT